MDWIYKIRRLASFLFETYFYLYVPFLLSEEQMTEEIFLNLSDIDLKTAKHEIEVYKNTGIMRKGVVHELMKELRVMILNEFIVSFEHYVNRFSASPKEDILCAGRINQEYPKSLGA